MIFPQIASSHHIQNSTTIDMPHEIYSKKNAELVSDTTIVTTKSIDYLFLLFFHMLGAYHCILQNKIEEREGSTFGL